jgi:hypothetical protein
LIILNSHPDSTNVSYQPALLVAPTKFDHDDSRICPDGLRSIFWRRQQEKRKDIPSVLTLVLLFLWEFFTCRTSFEGQGPSSGTDLLHHRALSSIGRKANPPASFVKTLSFWLQLVNVCFVSRVHCALPCHTTYVLLFYQSFYHPPPLPFAMMRRIIKQLSLSEDYCWEFYLTWNCTPPFLLSSIPSVYLLQNADRVAIQMTNLDDKPLDSMTSNQNIKLPNFHLALLLWLIPWYLMLNVPKHCNQ